MNEKKSLLQSVIYQVFVRDYPSGGTLKSVTDDLDRIAALGADILYLMPIQPIGKVGRKGTLGSPYAIEDYGEVDPALGSLHDLEELTEKAHERGMKVLLDVVYNHTSRDSRLLREHPDFFFRDSQGNFGNKTGAWSDVYDLDHQAEGLDEKLVSYLEEYKNRGIDGFRFDVASLIPASFYQLARRRLGEEMIFLAECIDTDFINYVRSLGYPALSNAELALSGIDLFYPYASYRFMEDCLRSKETKDLEAYLVALQLEAASLPAGHYVTRSIENHDRPRLASYSDSETFTENLLAFSFFPMGPAFVYFGEEFKDTHRPSLFEKETVSLKERDPAYSSLFKTLMSYKRDVRHEQLRNSLYEEVCGHVLIVRNVYPDHEEYGLFNLSSGTQKIFPTTLSKGRYQDLLTGRTLTYGEEGLDVEKPLFLVLDAQER